MTGFAKQARFLILAATLFFSAALSSQSARWAWKEYSYPQDGFAISLPVAPQAPHKDPNNTNMTVYTVHFTADSGMSLRVVNENRDCAATLNQLKDGALHNKQPEQPINPKSVRDVSLGEYPGVEYEFRFDSEYTVYDRFVCVNGRFYNFSAKWPTKQPRPAAVNHAIESFKILKTKPPK
jgi:hypothetical protein